MNALYEQYGIAPERIARVVAFAIDQAADVTINEFTVDPSKQVW
jgi:NADP-dependent 3-hydroxy acid dehydrogenase YdfG